MSIENPKRGRPKTLDREHVIRIALQSYWDLGPTSVSINEICEKAGVSKPGLYREFGNDDGLKVAVLDYYDQTVLKPMYEILDRDDPFSEVVAAFIEFVTQDRCAIGVPPGCLQVSMRAQRVELGELTGKKVDELRENTLARYKALIERAKKRGEFPAKMSSDVGARLLDTLNGGAMQMQKENVPDETIRDVLQSALSPYFVS